MFTDPGLLVSRLFFVGFVLEAIEVYSIRREFDEKGLFSREAHAVVVSGSHRLGTIAARLGGGTAITIAMAAQAAAAAVLVVLGTAVPAGVAALFVCLTANSYLRQRRQIGGSGAEQLSFIVLVTFALVILSGGGEPARHLGDGFIAAQVLLAYFASGVSKLVSPIWRKGGALGGVLSTEGYGIPALADILVARPRMDQVMCWLVIIWEIAFPLVLALPKPAILALFSIGVIFHSSCAYLMGLNRFVWAFCGCYPAVWSTAMLLR